MPKKFQENIKKRTLDIDQGSMGTTWLTRESVQFLVMEFSMISNSEISENNSITLDISCGTKIISHIQK